MVPTRQGLMNFNFGLQLFFPSYLNFTPGSLVFFSFEWVNPRWDTLSFLIIHFKNKTK